MALPDYFGRNAVAVAQAISGLDEDRLRPILDNVSVGITTGIDAHGAEGRASLDLLVRLLARLYPRLVIRSERGESIAADASELARRINPRVDLEDGPPTVEIVIGRTRKRSPALRRIYVGSDGWTARVSTSQPQACGRSDIPIGAGVAACLGAANLFRHAFLPEPMLDTGAEFSPLLDGELRGAHRILNGSLGELVLAGAGAIGNAAAWVLSRVTMDGRLTVVDHERVDLGNLQRYVLAEASDVDAVKPTLLMRYFNGPVVATSHDFTLAEYLQATGHRTERLLLALDSARDRRAAQASLPRWVANGWTQPGDLGVSTHNFLSGACVNCLYLPEHASQNEDAIIAEAFGIPSQLMQIRVLLHQNEGMPRDVLEAIAAARQIPLDRLLPFEGRPVRSLYTEGFCGGAVIPLGQVGTPRSDVHVPLAHQSAMAGVLLAAAAIRNALGGAVGSSITQVDVLKPLPASHTRPAAKDPRGICICQDDDYRTAYEQKYRETPARARWTAVGNTAAQRGVSIDGSHETPTAAEPSTPS